MLPFLTKTSKNLVLLGFVASDRKQGQLYINDILYSKDTPDTNEEYPQKSGGAIAGIAATGNLSLGIKDLK